VRYISLGAELQKLRLPNDKIDPNFLCIALFRLKYSINKGICPASPVNKCLHVADNAGSSYLYMSGKHRKLRHQQLQQEDHDSRRASSRGIIPKAKVKTVKMTFVIVFGKLLIVIHN